MPEPTSYVFAGGGSGGHLFPGIAVAEVLLDRYPNVRVQFVGSDRAIERRILEQHNYRHTSLPVVSTAVLKRNPFKFLWQNAKSIREALRLLKQQRPGCVVGLGGFASVPVGLAAARLGIPLVLLEQNAVAGRATRLLSRWANVVCTSFPVTVGIPDGRSQIRCTGNPVRRPFCAAASESAQANHAADNSVETRQADDAPTKTLLVLGGSQGAAAVNAAVVQAVSELKSQLSSWRIVHQAGAAQTDWVQQQYAALGIRHVVAPFFDNVIDWYRRADVVVSRAGATSLAELSCIGCPALLVPYPNSLGDHQVKNARFYREAGAALMVEETGDCEETCQRLSQSLESLVNDPDRRSRMRAAMQTLARPNAAQEVAALLARTAVESA
jgi:UDP-N-acetylglucosamine--N-acetylmuramyl-(pentapeptide) pyrophosphoryl-undecaprenol N-acetylglucosamine transferase